MRILLLSTAQNCFATQRITKEGNSGGHKMTVIDPLKLFLLISNSELGYDRLFHVDGKNVSRVNIKYYDAIIPRLA